MGWGLGIGEREEIRAHGAAEYPFESCGMVLVRDGDGERVVLKCENVARWVEKEYVVHPDDLRRGMILVGEGFRLAVIYHSHVDGPATFSIEDRRRAILAGVPRHPEVLYLVTSVYAGAAMETRGYRWLEGSRCFEEVVEA